MAEGKEYARITQELARQVREAADLEEACMAFARLSHACGQCHHALDRGPPMKLDETPEGEDLKMHMRRHYWAVERMWEASGADIWMILGAGSGYGRRVRVGTWGELGASRASGCRRRLCCAGGHLGCGARLE